MSTIVNNYYLFSKDLPDFVRGFERIMNFCWFACFLTKFKRSMHLSFKLVNTFGTRSKILNYFIMIGVINSKKTRNETRIPCTLESYSLRQDLV